MATLLCVFSQWETEAANPENVIRSGSMVETSGDSSRRYGSRSGTDLEAVKKGRACERLLPILKPRRSRWRSRERKKRK